MNIIPTRAEAEFKDYITKVYGVSPDRMPPPMVAGLRQAVAAGAVLMLARISEEDPDVSDEKMHQTLIKITNEYRQLAGI